MTKLAVVWIYLARVKEFFQETSTPMLKIVWEKNKKMVSCKCILLALKFRCVYPFVSWSSIYIVFQVWNIQFSVKKWKSLLSFLLHKTLYAIATFLFPSKKEQMLDIKWNEWEIFCVYLKNENIFIHILQCLSVCFYVRLFVCLFRISKLMNLFYWYFLKLD